MSTVTACLDTDDFNYVARLVLERSAIVLEANKTYLVESRLTPLARQQGHSCVGELVARVRGGDRETARLVVEAMTTNETSFFRDVHPFEALKQEILPRLIQQRAAERTLSIWSNACSSGQEIYSVAMILREHFGHLGNWNVRLIASDLSSQILARAREGLFNQTEVNRGLPAPLLVKYFQREGLHWRIKTDLRKLVDFREVNLVENWPTTLPPMDVIFLRNVLIYFSPETKMAILQKVRRLLRPDGCLFLGGAETTINLDPNFERLQAGKAFYYQCKPVGK